jgi:hypothetical protein
MKYFSFLFIVFSFASCTKKEENNAIKDNRFLIAKDSLFLPLDSLTKTDPSSLQYLSNNQLLYSSDITSRILFYDLNTKKVVNAIKLEREGTNGLGKGELGVSFINKDSIVVGSSTYDIFIINDKMEILYKNNFYKRKMSVKPFQPHVATTSQPIIKNEKIYLSGMPYLNAGKLKDFENFPALFEVDLKSDDVKSLMNFPEPYQKGLYGANFALHFHTYNPINQTFVISFAADPNVYTYSLQSKKTKRYYAPSKHFTNIPPMPEGMDAQDFNNYLKFYIQSNSYGAIYYDKYRDVYYRFAERAVDEVRYKEKKWWKFKSVIVLDKDFNKIGETDLPDGVNSWCVFISEQGLYIQTSQKSTEDSVLFVRYELTKK